mmetsp:Transcript_22827/g.64822  ORF Transcript_22827/g.64822 Transcript_22827/m.64822 type:complete len:270 (-) Transcript_22827:693-1502(-)
MKPTERPSTKRPLRQPFARDSSASSRVNAPQLRSRSTKQHAMQPSTLRMRLAFFCVVICSTSSAKSRVSVAGKCFLANSFTRVTRMSGLVSDLILWPMPMMSLLELRMFLTKVLASSPRSTASLNMRAASSSAPPKRGPMVSRPETRDEMRSLPARAHTMVLWAPDTAGPWSAVIMRTISIKVVAYSGRRRLNHSRPMTPPRPSCSLKTSEIGMPAYRSSSPRSSQMEDTNAAGLRTRPRVLAQLKSMGTLGTGGSGLGSMIFASTIFR